MYSQPSLAPKAFEDTLGDLGCMTFKNLNSLTGPCEQCEELKGKIGKLEADVEGYKTHCSISDKQKQDLEKINKDLAQSLDALKDKYKQETTQAKKTKGDIRKLQDEVRDKDERLQEFKTQIKELRRDNQELAGQLEELRRRREDNDELEYYKTQTKELNQKLSSQKERISFLESTLKSTGEKPPRPDTSLKKETTADSMRVPTFSNNVFTLEDEDSKSHKNAFNPKDVSKSFTTPYR